MTATTLPPPERIAAVYQIRNQHSGSVYIGSSVDPISRWRGHKSHLNKGRHHSIALQRAWDKYGAEAFVFEVIAWKPESLIRIAEGRMYVAAQAKGKTYNAAPVDPTLGVTRRSADSIARSRAAHVGRKYGPEARRNMSTSAMGNTCAAGHTMSEESKRKIGDANRGRKHTQEAKDKVAAAGRRRGPPSAEARERMRIAALNRTPEHRENLRLKALEREARKRAQRTDT